MSSLIPVQTYVYMVFTREFHDAYNPVTNDKDETWGDAYNGMCIANGIVSFLVGLIVFVAVPARKASA